jgi:peptidoglycan/LPS O-acetylase OafA/YrhL
MSSHPSDRGSASATLSEAISGRDNGFGILRLFFALLVLVDHAFPLGGFGEDVMWHWSRGQESFGGIAVGGFFAISGYLIAKSSFGTDGLQFLWRRGLRIFPGYWAVLAVTAFLVGPVLWKLQGLGLRTYFTRNEQGPLYHLTANFFLDVGRYGIYDLLKDTPYGQKVGGSVFNGSIWSLIHEWRCYLLVFVLAMSGAMRRARPLVVVVTVFLYLMMGLQQIDPTLPGKLLPLLSNLHSVRFTALFMLGALCALYAREIPFDDRLGLLSAAVYFFSLFRGGYFLLGYPALTYLLLWSAARMPKLLRAVGAVNDYSYGTYLYGFLVQQLLARAGAYRLGYLPYLSLAVVLTLGCAWLSWHLIEKPALSLKDAGPGRGVHGLFELWRARRMRGVAAPAIDGVGGRPPV